MKPIKIDNLAMKKVIQSDNSYIQVGERIFLLTEVENVKNTNCYEVTDPQEEKRLLQALNDANPVLSEEEITNILGFQK